MRGMVRVLMVSGLVLVIHRLAFTAPALDASEPARRDEPRPLPEMVRTFQMRLEGGSMEWSGEFSLSAGAARNPSGGKKPR